MPKSPDSDPPDSTEPAFEDALAQLEELVQEMESDRMPLEDLIKHYEEGTRLFQVCEKRLDEAEGRIEIIRKNRSGDPVVENFDGAESEPSESEPSESGASAAPDTSDDEEEANDNGELF